MSNHLKLHLLKLLFLVLCANAGLAVYLMIGILKPWHEINWMDVLGEGSSACFILAWLLMLLASRPGGRVTNFLAVGLACMFLSTWLDVLDEFIAFAPEMKLDNIMESAPVPIGMLLLTLGIYHWHKEQQAINGQMEKRERLFREHLLFDTLTPLSRAGYFKRQLGVSLLQAERAQQPLSLILLDIDDFDLITDRYGNTESDAILLAISQLLVLNLRRHDLVCRLAGDRFAILLPHTGEHEAHRIAAELKQSIVHLAHRSRDHGERIRLRASSSVAMARHRDTPTSLMEKLNSALHSARPAQQC